MRCTTAAALALACTPTVRYIQVVWPSMALRVRACASAIAPSCCKGFLPGVFCRLWECPPCRRAVDHVAGHKLQGLNTPQRRRSVDALRPRPHDTRASCTCAAKPPLLRLLRCSVCMKAHRDTRHCERQDGPRYRVAALRPPPAGPQFAARVQRSHLWASANPLQSGLSFFMQARHLKDRHNLSCPASPRVTF